MVTTDGRATMQILPSFLQGSWVRGHGAGTPVRDAVTGEEVARVSSAGLDLSAAVAYARSVGGPALRELTFPERAAMLKTAAAALREHREELYALSARSGATRADAKVDVDGGFGTALV
jgi:oxepin-CoA hydrolase/3-oxo-5,6-dehydrosuberyl-CoA semialdehyde dehydrogenase